MKKRTIITLLLGIVLIIAGGISSIFFYQRLETEKKENTIKKTFKYDQSEELVINLKNKTNLHLSNSEDNNLQLRKNAVIYDTQEKDNTDWTIEKKGKQTIITIDNDHKNKEKAFQLSVFNFDNTHNDIIYLNLPDVYKKISIIGNKGNIHANDLNLTNLEIKMKNSQISAYNIFTEELLIENTSGNTYVSDSKFEKDVDIASTSGSIEVYSSTFQTLIAETSNGELYVSNTKGELKIANKTGDTYFNYIKGKTKASSKSGNILFSSSEIGNDIELETAHGDINIETSEASLEKNKLDFSTQMGSLDIFNEDLEDETDFKRNTGTNQIKVISKNGDLSVNILEEDDVEY